MLFVIMENMAAQSITAANIANTIIFAMFMPPYCLPLRQPLASPQEVLAEY